MMAINPQRSWLLNDRRDAAGPIIYWMSREQQAEDNWALLFAQQLALRQGVPLAVVFCLLPAYLGAKRKFDVQAYIRKYGHPI
jgi:deoxyribodipyrimidine photo-lyase